MNISWIIWLAIYILVSAILYDSIDKDKDYSTKLAVCITWPLIFAAFVLVAVLLIIVGAADLLFRAVFDLLRNLNGK